MPDWATAILQLALIGAARTQRRGRAGHPIPLVRARDAGRSRLAQHHCRPQHSRE